MKSSLLMNFSVDKETSTIRIERQFAASVSKVWDAWTDSTLLDQWWAPKPWQARTKTMDFKEGGYWLYAMVGPDGSEHWARADYQSITLMKRFAVKDSFCDSEGNFTADIPVGYWENEFNEQAGSTLVSIRIQYKTLSDLETIIQMGFKEGFEAALENLDSLLASQS